MARGGKREGAGRKPGSANVKTRAIADGAVESGDTPLEFMLRVMRDTGAEMAQRLDMAKAAAPYIHARLASVEVGNKDDKPFRQELTWASSEAEAIADPSSAS